MVPTIGIWNPDSWISPNNHIIHGGGFRPFLAENIKDSKPYKYVRTFSTVEREKSVAEMDKDSLKDYIGKVLGAGEPHSVDLEAA